MINKLSEMSETAMKKITDISYGEFATQKLDLYIPDSDNFSVFVYFHGGGIEEGDKSEHEHMASYFVSNNIAVIAANYRMYPTAHYPDFIYDAAAVVAWVKNNIADYGVCDKLFVGGSSAGGYLSQMLCYDKKYLEPYGIDPTDIDGYIHDAGQPTTHYNVLRERGMDSRKVVVDDAAPVYHIGNAEKYSPMMYIISDNDMTNRYEQTMMLIKTLEHFEYDMSKISLNVMHGEHCRYVAADDADGNNIFAKMVCEYIKSF